LYNLSTGKKHYLPASEIFLFPQQLGEDNVWSWEIWCLINGARHSMSQGQMQREWECYDVMESLWFRHFPESLSYLIILFLRARNKRK